MSTAGADLPTDGADLPAETADEIAQFVSDWLADDSVPGATVAVVDADGLRYVEGFGSRDRETNAPATARTVYGVGSCTKSVTATAVMQQVERGALALDDPVADHLDLLGDAPGDPVTVHDLLCHGSGLPSDGTLTALLTRLTDRGDGDTDLPMGGEGDFRRHVEGAAAERLTDEDRFFYYNTGYTLLGRVVEAVADTDYATAVREDVLDPLDMDRAGFTEERFRDHEDRMTPYNYEDGDPVAGSLAFDERLYAPGGLWASVPGLATHGRMLLYGGAVDGTRVLDDSSVERMTDQHATRDSYLDGRDRAYGYGLASEPFLDDELVGHGGMMGTTTAYVGYLAERGVGVAVGCNAAPGRHPSTVGRAVLAIVAGEDPGETVPACILERKAEPIEGAYSSHNGVRNATVERNGGSLSVSFDDPGWSWTAQLFPESLDPDDRTYYFVNGSGKRVPVTFDVTDDGATLLFQRWKLTSE
ncbi:MAG: serine hydrolase [Halobacteriaceae archaeon]